MSENTPPSSPEPDPWAEATDDVVRRAKEAAREAQDKIRAAKDEAQARRNQAEGERDEGQAAKDQARAEKDQARAERDKVRTERESRRTDEPWAEFTGIKDLQGIKDAVRSASEEVLAAMGHGRPGKDAADAGARAGNAANSGAEAANSAAESRTDAANSSADAANSSADAANSSADPGQKSADPVRDILAEVAAGRLAPDQAAVLIDQTRTSGTATTDESAKTATATTQSSGESATAGTAPVPATTNRLRVRAVGRRVRIIGEPFVSTVAVDGPHVVRQEGDTIVVTSEGEFGASIDGFTLMRSRSLRDVQERVFDIGRELSVRVNPNLAVEVEVTAGSVTAERLPGLEQVRVTAGSARVRDVDGPIDLLVQAGSAQVEGKITRGRSRLRAESGSLQLRLLPGSSVRIRPDVQLGRIQWEPPGKDREEHIVGLGDGILNLEVVMGTATVKEAP